MLEPYCTNGLNNKFNIMCRAFFVEGFAIAYSYPHSGIRG